ncbi:MAG: hypothetical protein QOI24_2161 [Acidobacteriota bacterium]|jgi:CHAT domain-containing protein|nr:hypothetical protein [Acidobacteriota bacterium]
MACSREDTNGVKGWRRTTESRFAGVTWQSCNDGRCGNAASTANRSCNSLIGSRGAAVKLFLSSDSCIDHAIAALENFAATDAAAKSDLAAAYYVRAQRDQQPLDLLRSLDAADGNSPQALFNRALAQEALGLSEDAIGSWQQLLKLDRTDWTNDAREHLARLHEIAANDAAAQWITAKEELPDALRRGDRIAVAALIAELPFSAQKYFEEIALPRWATEPTPEHFEEARLLATELSQRLRDPFDVEAIQAIKRASSQNATTLREAHLRLADARKNTHVYKTKNAAEAYAQAAAMFAKSDSPFRLLAELGNANSLRFDRPNDALATINELEATVRIHNYPHLLARIHGNRSNLLFYEGHPIEALSDLENSLDEYEPLGDQESIDNTAIAAIGLHRTAGQLDIAWREAVPAVRRAMRIVDTARRHALFGEAAATAAEAGFPRIGLAYQNAAIRLIQRSLIATVEPAEISHLQSNLAMALRARAGIKAIGHLPDAPADINEAIRLSQKDDDPLTRALQANFEEAKGQTLLQIDPKASAEAFTHALALSEGTDYRTFRTRLFAQRAAAWRRSGRTLDAKNDLRSALQELRSEEAGVLKNRPAKVDDELWSAYFARFQETYRLLIRQLVEEHQWEEAFHYAEKARGYEPLNLVMARHPAPGSFNGISAAGEPASLDRVRQELPRGTFLFEYCVLDDRTYTWIISRDGFDVVTQLVPRERIRRWSAQLQRAVKRPDITAFDTVLFAQYDGLIAAPLRAAMKMSGGRAPERLVIIPDDAMHGLPLAASSRNSQPRTYLIEEMPVEVDGSATLYLLALARDAELASSGNSSALLVGDPAFNERLPRARGLQRLSGARSEVERLRKLYEPRVTMLVDREATIPEFLRLAKESAFIQLAAHGVVDATAPSRSALILAPSPGNDGVLDAQTLLKELKLDRTRLVVLSACSSAGGLPVGPEGVAPLVRPLIAAGAPAVIGSLWPVNDATAADLFVSFHQHYRMGSDAAVALQAAQIEMLKKKLTWASFQVIGHASSPFAPNAGLKKEKPP